MDEIALVVSEELSEQVFVIVTLLEKNTKNTLFSKNHNLVKNHLIKNVIYAQVINLVNFHSNSISSLGEVVQINFKNSNHLRAITLTNTTKLENAGNMHN